MSDSVAPGRGKRVESARAPAHSMTLRDVREVLGRVRGGRVFACEES